MSNKLKQIFQPLLKILVILTVVLGLTLGHMDSAAAARTGGRIGGGSFRAPSSRTYTPRTYAPGGGGYYAPAPGGFGFPFLIPFFGFGGFSGILGLFVMIAIANFLLRTFRQIGSGDMDGETYTANPTVSVNRLQVGLLANARTLQPELDRIAEFADTNTNQGRAQVLQEVSLALLRHPEYWVYAGVTSQQAKLNSAEAEFNRLALAERSKFNQETLANVNNQLTASQAKAALTGDNHSELDAPGEYIVVSVVTATLGKYTLPNINNTEELQTALRQIGSLGSDNLLALEVIWTPQAEGDTLTSDDLLANYADLKLV